jgi:hypothetical protein
MRKQSIKRVRKQFRTAEADAMKENGMQESISCMSFSYCSAQWLTGVKNSLQLRGIEGQHVPKELVTGKS